MSPSTYQLPPYMFYPLTFGTYIILSSYLPSLTVCSAYSLMWVPIICSPAYLSMSTKCGYIQLASSSLLRCNVRCWFLVAVLGVGILWLLLRILDACLLYRDMYCGNKIWVRYILWRYNKVWIYLVKVGSSITSITRIYTGLHCLCIPYQFTKDTFFGDVRNSSQ